MTSKIVKSTTIDERTGRVAHTRQACLSLSLGQLANQCKSSVQGIEFSLTPLPVSLFASTCRVGALIAF
jgi:hypothetical protein